MGLLGFSSAQSPADPWATCFPGSNVELPPPALLFLFVFFSLWLWSWEGVWVNNCVPAAVFIWTPSRLYLPEAKLLRRSGAKKGLHRWMWACVDVVNQHVQRALSHHGTRGRGQSLKGRGCDSLSFDGQWTRAGLALKPLSPSGFEKMERGGPTGASAAQEGVCVCVCK